MINQPQSDEEERHILGGITEADGKKIDENIKNLKTLIDNMRNPPPKQEK